MCLAVLHCLIYKRLHLAVGFAAGVSLLNAEERLLTA
jgi:hypothetical protein